MNRRLLLGVLGCLLVAGVAVAEEAVAGLVPVDALVVMLGNDYLLVAAVAACALVAGAVAAERGTGVKQASVPDPEDAVSVPAPGDEFAAEVDRWRLAVPLVGEGARAAVRERLRSAAVGAVGRAGNCSPAAAAQRVEMGTWTDDDTAAAFLAADEDAGGDWLAALSRGETPFAYRARRTADAVAAVDDRRAAAADGGEER